MSEERTDAEVIAAYDEAAEFVWGGGMSIIKDFKAMIRQGDFVVLDSETTGLGGDAEICQIAVVDARGIVLIDTLVKPTQSIPAEATAIHGITDEMVADAPSWPEVFDRVEAAIGDRDVVIYNAEYDLRVMRQSYEAHGRTDWIDRLPNTSWCAMETFAEIYGEWSDYRQSYRWQKLATAVRYYNVPALQAHTALADCQMTLEVCRAMVLGEVAT